MSITVVDEAYQDIQRGDMSQLEAVLILIGTLFVVGILCYGGTAYMVNRNHKREWAAYENRDDATIKTCDDGDDKEVDDSVEAAETDIEEGTESVAEGD